MNAINSMIRVELHKAIRSRMPLYTALGSLLMPLGMGFLIFAAKNPDISHKLGLISAKANLVSYAGTNWSSYMSLYAEIIAAAGCILFTLIVSWVFGREFTDGTLKDMWAVPVPRGSILTAKYIATAIWCLAMAVVILAAGLGMGVMLQLPQGSAEIILNGSLITFIAALMTIVTILPFAFFASAGRGYLLPIGTAILVMILGNVVNVAGWGEYFPWAISTMYAQGQSALPQASYWIVVFTGIIGVAITYTWWKFADQSK
jgi:ABC-2 type transport system permease protein